MKLEFLVMSMFLLFSGCFWKSEKDIALKAVKDKIEAELLAESKATLQSKPIFHKRYVSIIGAQTELKIDNAAEINGIATVVINVKTISEFGRYNLREVFGKQNESRDTNFNGTEALDMILKMVNKDSEKYALRTYAVKINTKKDSEVTSVMQVK